MKSIWAKQSPQRSPWDWMRVRQAMHTGGSSRSVTAPSAARQMGMRGACVSLIAMAPMIPRERAPREAS